MEFVRELIARAAASGSFGASALDHEIGNHSMEDDAIVERLPGLVSFGEIDEILYRLRHFGIEELRFKPAFGRIEYRVCFICHIFQFYRDGTVKKRPRKTEVESTHVFTRVAADPDLG